MILYGDALNRSNPLTRGLVSFWLPLPGRGTGRTLYDLAGRNDGTLVGGPTWEAGINGFGSLSYDGTDDSVTSGSAITLNDFTLAVLFRTTGPNASYPGLLSTDYISTNGVGILHTPNSDGGGVYGSIAGASNTNIGYPVPTATNDGIWRLAVLTRNSTTGAAGLYLNGQLRASATAVTGSITTGSGFRLGSRGATFYNGGIGLGAYWGVELSASLVREFTTQVFRGFPSLLRRTIGPRYGGFSGAPASTGFYLPAITGLGW